MKMAGQQSLNVGPSKIYNAPQNHIITIIISLQLEHPMNNEPRLLSCDLFHAIVIYSTQLWFVFYKNKTFPAYIINGRHACAVGVFPLLARHFRKILDLRMRTGVLLIVGLFFSYNTQLRMRSVNVAGHYSLLARPLAMILDYACAV